MMTSLTDLGVDPTEVVKGVGYGITLFLTWVLSEVRRSRAAKEHAVKQSSADDERERQRDERRERNRRAYETALDYRFSEVHRDMAANRKAIDAQLQDVSQKVERVSTIVGVNNENGLRGEIRAQRQRMDAFLRDELNRANDRANA